jgi:hypothetical protein
MVIQGESVTDNGNMGTTLLRMESEPKEMLKFGAHVWSYVQCALSRFLDYVPHMTLVSLPMCFGLDKSPYFARTYALK